MRVPVFVTEWIEMKKAALQRIERCKREDLCVACLGSLEGEKKIVRGCHDRCYAATFRAIRRKAFTEEQRIAEGKLLTADPGGRPASNPVTVEANGAA